jgi:hypothetical protein
VNMHSMIIAIRSSRDKYKAVGKEAFK